MGYFSDATTPNTTAPATSFVLSEVDGDTLTLKDRALPYRPVSISGRQRAEFTWYPGSPNATVQMLGPEEGVISLRGFWKDRFIAGNGNALVQKAGSATSAAEAGGVTARGASASAALTGIAFVASGGLAVDSVADLVAQVDNMRRNGKLIMLQWDSLIRHGHITSFTQTWHNQHDVEWELEFSVIAHDSMAAPSLTKVPTVADISITAQALWEKLSTAVNAAIADNPLTNTIRYVANEAQGIQSFAKTIEADTRQWANNINNVAHQALLVIQTPNEVGRSLLGAISGPTETAFKSAGALIDGAATELFVAIEPFGGVQQDNVPFGLQIAQKSYVTRVKSALTDIKTSNAIWRSEYTRELQQEGVQSYVASADTDLRDVSTRFYGTPDNWQALMLYNGMMTSRLSAGMTLFIPPRLQGGPAGRP